MHGLSTFETLAQKQARHAAAQAQAKREELNRKLVATRYGVGRMLAMSQEEVNRVAAGGNPTPAVVKLARNVGNFFANLTAIVNVLALPVMLAATVFCMCMALSQHPQQKADPAVEQGEQMMLEQAQRQMQQVLER